ncbi:MAG: hypothetical protein DWQ07_14920 [Chloroflexi bacterium]|nr:MAG: hypothetical protein DWQ07_14920 [Chloroflexota bacterium]MBL1195626.1 hypothetical protein [Chloroflexota bacterium]NOH12914.1 hypothetical protein [Chloroflexota bacterium]
MRARVVPLFFKQGRDEDFDKQLDLLKDILADDIEFLPEVGLGDAIPEADAVLFPQILGEAYRQLDDFRAINLPILIITTEFGTMAMWDWEIIKYLQSEGVEVIAPYNMGQTKNLARALAVKSELQASKFLVYQDNPGEGFQPEIFKRFYWWENECTQRMFDKYGVTLEKKSFLEMATQAKELPEEDAEEVWQEWSDRLPLGHINTKQRNSALKVYLKLKEAIEADDTIKGMGINCLNESAYSDTTPCLAWNMLYEERQMIWGCEADTVVMLSKYLLHKSLDVPIMMTNMYPFLMGDAALKHERIPYFPDVKGNPDNYILAAHCGYFGVVPQSFSTEWALRSKVLAIVDDNATAIDARLPEGPITLAKLHPTLDTMSVIEGEIEKYSQFEDSDCLNGAVIRVSDGHQLVSSLTSHHYLILTGHRLAEIRQIARVFDFEIEAL